jgi:hypothetical protein
VLQVAEWWKAEEKISDAFFDGNQRVRPFILRSYIAGRTEEGRSEGEEIGAGWKAYLDA